MKKEKIDLKTIYKQQGKEGILITLGRDKISDIYSAIPKSLLLSVRLPKQYQKSEIDKGPTIENENLNNLVKSHTEKSSAKYIYEGVYHFNKGLIVTDGARLLFHPCKIDKKYFEKCYSIRRFTTVERNKLIHFSFKEFSLKLAKKKADNYIKKEINENLKGTFPDFNRIVQKDIPYYKQLEIEKTLIKVLQLIKIFSDKRENILGSVNNINFNLGFLRDLLTFFYQQNIDKIFIFSTGDKMRQIIFSINKNYRNYTKSFCLLMPDPIVSFDFVTEII